MKEKEKKQTILIVDDDESIRITLKNIIDYEGYGCLLADDGIDALEQLTDNKIDLVLLDLRLPRMNGMDVLKEAKKTNPNLPVIIVSGQGTIKLAVEATKLGAYDFIDKPLSADRIMLTIRNALEMSKLKSLGRNPYAL